MAGITKAQAEAQLTLCLAASEAVSRSQSYSIGGRSLTRANLKEIREMIKFYQNIISDFENQGIKQTRFVPRDI